MARCADRSLYIGVTDDTQKRIERHNRGEGARWFLKHGAGIIIFSEEYPTRLEARRRERQLKKWSRMKKERLIRGEKL